MKLDIKKIVKIFTVLIGTFFCVSKVQGQILSGNLCESKAVDQLAMIIYEEVGTLTSNKDEAFFAKITAGSIALNNASGGTGNTIAAKIQNMTDNQYQGHSKYKYSTISNCVSSPGEYIYIAGLVLSHKYNVPNNLIYQIASYYLPGPAWATVYATYAGAYTTSFGTGGPSPVSKDIFGSDISTSASDFRTLSKTLQLSDYSSYTLNNVCSLIADGTTDASLPDTKVNYYTINYDLDGGTFPTGETNRTVIISDDKGKIDTPKINPIKEKSKFVGWYVGDNLFDFDSKITSDITLKAKYSTFDKSSFKCNSGDYYEPAINKCINIFANNNLKTISSVYDYNLTCSNGKNAVSNFSCTGACNKIELPSGYEKEYWKSLDTCKVGSSCINSSSCKEEIKAYFYKMYDASNTNKDIEEDKDKNDIIPEKNQADEPKKETNNSKANNELNNNLKTGATLITIVFIVGFLALGYSIYYFIKNKTNFSM